MWRHRRHVVADSGARCYRFRVPDPTFIVCPHCGKPIELPSTPAEAYQCPHCGGAFSAPGAGEQNASAEQTPANEAALDHAKILKAATARRAAIRASSYCLIAAITCFVAAGELTWMAVHQFRAAGPSAWEIVYLLLTFPALLGTVRFLLRARQLRRESRQSALLHNPASPDFSTLRLMLRIAFLSPVMIWKLAPILMPAIPIGLAILGMLSTVYSWGMTSMIWSPAGI